MHCLTNLTVVYIATVLSVKTFKFGYNFAKEGSRMGYVLLPLLYQNYIYLFAPILVQQTEPD